MPIKLKCFDTIDYFHVCGMHMKRFTAGAKGNVRIDYHFPHGVMVHRNGKQSEFIPIHCVRTVTPENPEDLQAALGDSPEKSVENLKDAGFAVTLVDKDNSTIVDGPIPKKKRKRRTKAEMEAARAAAS